MKTVEERAREISDDSLGYYEYDEVKIAALLRSDREAVLRRVEVYLYSSADTVKNDIAALKKELL